MNEGTTIISVKDMAAYKDIVEMLVSAGIQKEWITWLKTENFTTIDSPYINLIKLDLQTKKQIDLATIKKYFEQVEDIKNKDLGSIFINTKENDFVLITKDFFKILLLLYVSFSNISDEELDEYQDIKENKIPLSMTKGNKRSKKT